MHANVYADNSKYEISCGIGSLTVGSFTITKITTDIPFISKEESPKYAFGCAVKSLQNGLKLHSEIKVPRPITLTTIGEFSTEAGDKRTIIKSEPMLLETAETGNITFRLDDNDTTGYYKVGIYIDNYLSKSVIFNVYK